MRRKYLYSTYYELCNILDAFTWRISHNLHHDPQGIQYFPLHFTDKGNLGLGEGSDLPHNSAPFPGTHRFLANNHALHSLHLRHMVIIGTQFTTLDALVDAYQEVSGDVLTIVDPYMKNVTQEYVMSIWRVDSRGVSIISHTQHEP